MKPIDMNEVVIHPMYGPAKIIKDYGLDERSRRKIRIKFVNTGFEMDTRYDTFKAGKIRDDYYGIDFNKIYESNSYGPVKILEYVGRNNDNRTIVKCQFLNTGSIADFELRQVLKGKIRDPILGFKLDKLYPSNTSGPFRILKVIPGTSIPKVNARCLIEFTLTGYRKLVFTQNIPTGEVKDDSQNRIIPVDKSLFDNYDEWLQNRLRIIWNGMVDRCTNENSSFYKSYGYIGVSIDPEWLDFNTFSKDVRELPQFDKYYNSPFAYQLDKDFIQKDIPRSKRIYSKSTCMFLYYLDNLNMRAIDYLKENYDTISSKYFGVVKAKKLYKTSIMLNNNAIHIGTFTDEIMAAAAFTYFERKYHPYELIPLFNDVPDISPSEFVKYNVSAKLMYKLINHE